MGTDDYSASELMVRMPLMRTVSMEHRWQDLANFLSLPDGHGANLTTHHSHHNTVHHHHGGHHHSGHAALLTSSPHSHPFAHPYPHPHSHPHPHPHSIGNHSNPNGHYGVHHSAAAAHAHAAAQAAAHAAHAAVGHHHYGGMPATATPVSAYSMSQAGGGGGGGSGGGGSGDSASSTGAGRVTAVAATSVLLGHNASLTEIGVANGANNGSYPSPVSLGSGVTLGSAVTTSMNLTSNGTSEALEPAVQVSYKTESTPDMHQLYYQNNTSEVNQTGDGFFPSIFNEDDLQLMDMAMTDTMYPTRLLEGQSVGQHHSVQVLTNVTGVSTSASGVGATTATISVPSSTVIGDTTSDSAVSSMGSERVPSISDGDWIDSSGVGNDSNATATGGASAVVPSTSAYSIDYASGAKYRHYEYGYGARQNGGPGGDASGAGPRSVAAPVAQKKHHMFGKRVFHDQTEMAGSPSTAVHSPQSQAAAQGVVPKFDYGAASAGAMYSPHPSTPLDGATNLHSMDMKYACPMDYNHHPHEVRGTMDHINLNHTYAMGADAGASQRPVSRDKQRASSSGLRGSVSDTSAGAGTSGSSSESEAYSRDEKRARAMNIPMTVDDIINLPMDEFNERLSKYDLTEAQLSLIRDIRRRGKNKVAAQNCRKRKLDQILTLADEVKRVRERKIRLNKEREFLLAEKARIKDRFAQLYRHVFQSLRDADGQPYSPYEYSLQQSADGNILLVPRGASHGAGPIDPQPSVNPAVNGDVHLGARRKNPDHKTEP